VYDGEENDGEEYEGEGLELNELLEELLPLEDDPRDDDDELREEELLRPPFASLPKNSRQHTTNRHKNVLILFENAMIRRVFKRFTKNCSKMLSGDSAIKRRLSTK
jgi:hypothetical protein